MGIRAFGFSSGLAVNVENEEPGPQRMKARSPGLGIAIAWGMLPVLAKWQLDCDKTTVERWR
jgi:hypothetical protein